MNKVNKWFFIPVMSLGLAVALSACGQDKEEDAVPPAQDSPADTSSAKPMAEDAYVEESAPVEGTPDEELMHGALPEEDEAAQGQSYVYFVSPEDGDEVTNPVIVVFGLEGMEVAPAGTPEPGTGHHHLLVDVDDLPPLDQPIPADENHIHFGKGQTETELELEPGEHTLQLLFADGNHIPHDPPMLSEPITITVIQEATRE